MKYSDALKIIEGKEDSGFMVHFEWREEFYCFGDHFPEKHSGEKLIETKEEAWKLAEKFAAATKGRCQYITVVDGNFRPVSGCIINKIKRA